jgi:putative colanic acid biosynthesis acetyltransferase WcaF
MKDLETAASAEPREPAMQSRYEDPTFDQRSTPLPRFGGATFALRFRIMQLVWRITWTLLASWTPPPFRRWRNFLLCCFGAQLDPTAIISASVKIWWPGHLVMGKHTSLGPGAICYNVATVTLKDFSIVSQRAHLCTGSHDIQDSQFPLISRPIVIEPNAWIAAEAFVGPGVVVGEGAVLGARGVAAKSLQPWTIYVGNPAKAVGKRNQSAAASYALVS